MLKRIIFLFLIVAPLSCVFASHWVRGYTRSNGTYVQGHISDDKGEGAYGHWHNNQYYPNNGLSSGRQDQSSYDSDGSYNSGNDYGQTDGDDFDD